MKASSATRAAPAGMAVVLSAFKSSCLYKQYGYAFVERWEKATTLVHGFLMESKPGETVLAAHWHSERRSLLIKLTRKCVLAINR